MKNIKLLKILKNTCVLYSAIILYGSWDMESSLQVEASYEDDEKSPVGLYINAGLQEDFPIHGYESAIVDRDPRLNYQIEIGGEFFAVPLSLSTGQNVDIYSMKPRFQFLFPLTEYFISAGPGLGMAYNYWTSDFGLSGTRFSVSVHEIGIQPSLQIMIRPIRNINILITPAAIDLNVWRKVMGNSNARGLGNFSTTDSDIGIIYNAGASVGLSF